MPASQIRVNPDGGVGPVRHNSAVTLLRTIMNAVFGRAPNQPAARAELPPVSHAAAGILTAEEVTVVLTQLAARGSLRMRDVKVPAALVDNVYVDPDQWQTYITRDSPYYAGAARRPAIAQDPLPLDVRKVIARRSLLEFPRGAICNLGFGISQPEASLGNMLTEAQTYFFRNPWLVAWPGLVLILIVVSASFLGDGLRDALDPRQK